LQPLAQSLQLLNAIDQIAGALHLHEDLFDELLALLDLAPPLTITRPS
jgi:hypothetical protein